MELRLCAHCGLAIAPGAGRAQGCPKADCEPTIRVKPPRWLIGQTLGNYRIDAQIAVGGMGAVFRAQHLKLDRTVALKLMQPEPEFALYAERFRYEAQLLAELKHPHIVALYDYDIAAFGVPYFVMELLEGQTLTEWIRSHPNGCAREQWLPIAKAIASALSYAHGLGVVHRDLKPDNVMPGADPANTLKLVDFGISKGKPPQAGVVATPTLSATGIMVGTPLYAAPEQLSGEATSAATDQYAFALVIAEMINGRALRDGSKSTLEMLREAVQAPRFIQALATDPHTRRVLERALNAVPERRFSSIESMVAALEGAEFAEPVRSAAGAPAPTRRVANVDAKKPRAKLLVALAFGAALLAGAGFWLSRTGVPADLHPLVPAQPLRSFTERAIVSVPAQALGVLGYDAESASAILRSPNGWFLRSMSELNQGQAALSMELAAGERLVGYVTDAAGKSATGMLIEGLSGLERVSVDQQQRQTILPVIANPALWVDAEGAFVAIRQGDTIEIRLADRGQSLQKTLAIPTSSTFRLGAGRAFELNSAGLLTVTELRSENAPREYPLGFSELKALATLRDLDLIAALGPNGEGVVIDAARGAIVKTFRVSNGASALSWIPDRPTLLIVSAYGLSLWRPGMDAPERAQDLGFEAERWADAQLILNENFLGVLALDRLRNRLVSLDYGTLPVQSLGSDLHQHWSRTFTDSVGDVVYRSYADGVLERVEGARVISVQAHRDDPLAVAFDQELVVSAASEPRLKRWRARDLKALGEQALGADRAWGLARIEQTLYVLTSKPALEIRDWPSLELRSSVNLGVGEAVSFSINHTPRRALIRWRDGRLSVHDLSVPSAPISNTLLADGAGLGRLSALKDGPFHVLRQIDSRRLLLIDARDSRVFALPLFGLSSRNVQAIDSQHFYLSALGALLHYRVERLGDGLKVAVSADVRTDLFYDTVAWLPQQKQLLSGWRVRNGFRAALLQASALSQNPLIEKTLSAEGFVSAESLAIP